MGGDDVSDNDTALFERKLKLAESLSCRHLFADLEAVDAQIDQALRERVERDQRLAAAQAQVADTEALIALQAEGKNETERKARRTQLLLEDTAYQQALATVRDLDRQRDELDVALESLRRQARRIERQIEYRIAAMRLLGG
jgi:hypothetical protein